MAIPSWEILYDRALHSEAEGFLDAHRTALDAILQRMMFLAFVDKSLTAKIRERRALNIALSDLHVLRTAFRAG